MTWSHSQQVALALAPKFSSALSCIGSMCIILEIVSDRHVSKPKWRNPYHRLMLGMSIYDVLESIFNFLSTWPIPKGTANIAWAIGNEATCTAQGFFLMLGIAIPIYNACLSLYYVLVINFRYTDTQLRRWVEPTMHFVAFAWGFGTALSASVMQLMNNANLWCWIAPLPGDCVSTLGKNEDAEPNCDRGDNAWLYRWVFYLVPLWFCIFFATICIVVVFRYVRKLDHESIRYRMSGDMNVSQIMKSATTWAKRVTRVSGVSSQAQFDVENLSDDDDKDLGHDDDEDNDDQIGSGDLMSDDTTPRTDEEDEDNEEGKDENMENSHEARRSSFSRVGPKRVDMAGTMESAQNGESNNGPLHSSGINMLPGIEEEKVADDQVLGNYSSPLAEGPGVQSGDLSVRFDTSSRSGGIDGSSRVNFDMEGSSSIIIGYPDNGSQGSGDGSTKISARGVLAFAKAVSALKGKRSNYARDYKRTMEVYHQSLWYLGTFYITHFWSTTNRITQSFGKVPFAMLLLHSIFDPLQGFLNYIVYQRPRYLDIRKREPNIGRLGAMRKIISFYPWGQTESQATHTSRRSGLNESQSRQSQTKSEAVSNFDESARE